MEVAGLVVATAVIGDPLIRAIRSLRQLHHAVNDTPEVLNRLERDGRTISLYLSYVDEAITQDRSGYPDSFIRWFQDEKKLLERSTAKIEDYTSRIQQRLETTPLVNGVKTAFDVTDISKVQEQLNQSIGVIGHMMNLCQK